jgi:hypothetical protein
MAGKCAYHPEVEAVSGCVGCGRLICLQCRVVLEGKTYCSRCANEISLGKTAAKPEVDKGPAERYQALNARLVSARETQRASPIFLKKRTAPAWRAAWALSLPPRGTSWKRVPPRTAFTVRGAGPGVSSSAAWRSATGSGSGFTRNRSWCAWTWLRA